MSPADFHYEFGYVGGKNEIDILKNEGVGLSPINVLRQNELEM